jgi:hypothetical protein
MRLTQQFCRRLKTSRRHIFGNIMDLDHVCTLHRRWFENLRIRAWRPDYVDYRLTSKFYGLKQEIEVRGAPVDADRYWYEFNGPMARIRVDGEIDGPDGDLTLTETITFEFARLLAPMFWLLKPLFKQQKLDILGADSRLLERVYELEQNGFQRIESSGLPRVVVYGGAGFFGRCVVRDLLEYTDAQISVASRDPRPFDIGPLASRVRFHLSDATDPGSVSELIDGAQVVISCIGPYQGRGLELLESCIRNQVHYIDVADDRDFVERAYRLGPKIEEAGIIALIGCSVVPGLSALLSRRCIEKLGRLDRVRISITPGTRFPRGAGSFECLLATVGEPFVVPRNGSMTTVVGWTEPERVEFPPPIGPRTVYSVVDIADYFTQVKLFGAKTVEFKIGSEFGWLNRGLSGVREFRRVLGLRSLQPFVPLFRGLLGLASYLGTSRGAVLVEAGAETSSGMREMKLAVFRETDGHIIPALLPSIAARMILNGEVSHPGIPHLGEWLDFERLLEELSARGVSVAYHEGHWQLLRGQPVS